MRKSNRLNIADMAVLAMLGALMFVSKKLMELVPNVHLLGLLITVITIVYRKKALWPIYIYVFLEGVISGFAPWWYPYMYIWTVLWAAVMLIPQRLPENVKYGLYITVCALFGFLFGVLYAPGQALIYGYTFEMTLMWIAEGFLFDIIHGISNFLMGFLIYPLTKLLSKFKK